MEVFTIKITEVMERELCLEADSEIEALASAMKKYQERKYVLFPGKHVSTEFDIEEDSASCAPEIAV